MMKFVEKKTPELPVEVVPSVKILRGSSEAPDYAEFRINGIPLFRLGGDRDTVTVIQLQGADAREIKDLGLKLDSLGRIRTSLDNK
jgi:hypothetical protein